MKKISKLTKVLSLCLIMMMSFNSTFSINALSSQEGVRDLPMTDDTILEDELSADLKGYVRHVKNLSEADEIQYGHVRDINLIENKYLDYSQNSFKANYINDYKGIEYFDALSSMQFSVSGETLNNYTNLDKLSSDYSVVGFHLGITLDIPEEYMTEMDKMDEYIKLSQSDEEKIDTLKKNIIDIIKTMSAISDRPELGDGNIFSINIINNYLGFDDRSYLLALNDVRYDKYSSTFGLFGTQKDYSAKPYLVNTNDNPEYYIDIKDPFTFVYYDELGTLQLLANHNTVKTTGSIYSDVIQTDDIKVLYKKYAEDDFLTSEDGMINDFDIEMVRIVLTPEQYNAIYNNEDLEEWETPLDFYKETLFTVPENVLPKYQMYHHIMNTYNTEQADPHYTVTFDYLDGTENIMYDYIVKGSKIKEPTAPVKEGFKFSGWYREPSLETKWDFDADTVNENIILYVGWSDATEDKLEVTFNANGGSTVAPIGNIDTGSKILKPSDPTKAGYVFKGWYVDNNSFLREWNFSQDTVNQSLTLHAKWIPLESNPLDPKNPEDKTDVKDTPKTSVIQNSYLLLALLALGSITILGLNKKTKER